MPFGCEHETTRSFVPGDMWWLVLIRGVRFGLGLKIGDAVGIRIRLGARAGNAV